MVGSAQNQFYRSVLRPISCITNGCRFPMRGGGDDATHSLTELSKGLDEDALAHKKDLSQRLDTKSYHLETRKNDGQYSEEGVLDQSQCSFLMKLPVEVRIMIYCYVLCLPVPVVHIVRRKDGSLCHVRCRSSNGECGTYRCYNDYSELSRSTKGSASTSSEHGAGEGFLSLMFSCKKIYREAIHTAYNENTFSFFDLPVIDDFSSRTPQARLNTIQRIQFEYKLYSVIRHYFPSLAPALGDTLTWHRVRQILSGMQGLREIHVKVAKTPEAYGTPGMMPEVIRITDFVADRTDGASEAMRRLLEVENVDVMIEEVP
ncbi:hypothetical protein ACLMJK_005482 [Lecanora helva]